MSEESKRYLFAKFRRDEQTGTMSTFLISEDEARVAAWPDNKDAASGSEAATEPKDKHRKKKAEQDDDFESLTQDFVKSMNVFYRLVPAIMSVLPVLERIDVQRRIYEPIRKGGALVEKSVDTEFYKVEIDRMEQIDREFEAIDTLRQGAASLPGMFLMGLVSSYDGFLARLLKLIFMSKPEMLSSSERNISFKDLLAMGSVEAAREFTLEKEIENVIRLSHHAQFEWLQTQLNMPLTKGLAIWPAFIEICERRNLFTHTNGVVSNQYMKVCQSHKVDLGARQVGDKLEVDAIYLRDAIGTVTQLGLKLTQVVWRKLLPDDIGAAEDALSNVAYDLIARRRYKLACTMLHFGLIEQKKHGEDSVRKRMVVNYANVTKLMGNKEEALKILDGEDWSAVKDVFRFCVAAVREDITELIEMMPQMVGSKDISKQDIREWPVFRGVHNNGEFIAAFERYFGEPYFTDKEKGSAKVDELSAGDSQEVSKDDESSTTVH